ncbi:MAG TPA: lmo0937 family membrane protein [Thermomicrobiales bacterium]|nr:lmo0937 family membrane protein [Thermomicrobiales bacterium]
MAGLLWAILVIIVAVWLIGFLADIGGGLIHILLVVALIILIYNLIVGRRSV